MQKAAPRKRGKRGVEEAAEGGSPLRKSKRSRTAQTSDLPAPTSTADAKETIPDEDKDKINGTSPVEDDTGKAPRGRGQKKTKSVAEKAEVSTSVKSDKRERSTRKKASYVDQDTDSDIDKEVKEEEEEKEIAIKSKVKRKKKTKEEKESEAMPLAARTQGLRMFVGAHVSAAKGQLFCDRYKFSSGPHRNVHRLNYIPIGVQNAVTNSVHIG